MRPTNHEIFRRALETSLRKVAEKVRVATERFGGTSESIDDRIATARGVNALAHQVLYAGLKQDSEELFRTTVFATCDLMDWAEVLVTNYISGFVIQDAEAAGKSFGPAADDDVERNAAESRVTLAGALPQMRNFLKTHEQDQDPLPFPNRDGARFFQKFMATSTTKSFDLEAAVLSIVTAAK